MKKLKNGILITETYQIKNLKKLDDDFLSFLQSANQELYSQLITARENPQSIERKAESNLLINIAPYLEEYLATEFGIENKIAENKKNALFWQKYFVDIKRKFIQRRGLKKWTAIEVETFNLSEIINSANKYFGEFKHHQEFEKIFADKVLEWLADETTFANELDFASRYAAWAVISKEGINRHQDGYLFKRPELIDHFHLVPTAEIAITEIKVNGKEPKNIFVGAHKLRYRDGFNLTDTVKGADYVYDQSHYCIWCHEQGRDSCSSGIRDKKTNEIQKSPLGVSLVGCPLSEKISEMNLLKASGSTISAVAVAIVDNPMIAGTGHRICNECSKACIYQRQTPVDIPQAETRNFEDLINLPFGFEIYSLLTRWNPLNINRPITKTETGKKVLVVGLGPAGYTLSHHLLQDGHTVVAIDGLKIEPLPISLSGINQYGERRGFSEIENVSTLMDSLDNRILAGFGGVSEYGITVRWNKNYLKLIRIILERHPNFRMFGGVRFGNGSGTITIEDALDLGFDHIALCMGAGKPTVIEMENGFARGVRQASDFLMALQLTGASKLDSLANLQIRMPIVVIGGGLTAIDTATESLAYYIRQVEKFTLRNIALNKEKINWMDKLSVEEKIIADEFIEHGKQVLAEREIAKIENRSPNFTKLLNNWGGATIVYRRKLIEAPSYTLNHEEVVKALEEGIRFCELTTPTKVLQDEYAHCHKLICTDKDGNTIEFPAKAILIAAGTTPNTVISRENKTDTQIKIGEEINLDGKYFQAINQNGEKVIPQIGIPKPDEVNVLMHKFVGDHQNKFMSFFGDLHPSFFGNVVKAMSSAKQGYPIVSEVLQKVNYQNNVNNEELFAKLNNLLLAQIVRVERLTSNIVEVVVRAPQAAKNFQPGQFYRLQNYEATAPIVMFSNIQIKLAMEGVALTGAWVNKESGEVGLIALEMGGSSNIIASLEVDNPVILMGPTGAPTEIRENETVLLAGGGLGNAVLFSIGAAFRARGSKVLYFAAYKGTYDRYHVADIENAADEIIWCCDTAPGFTPSNNRPQDKSFVGNVVQAMLAFAEGQLGASKIQLSQVNRIIAIGSQMMMQAVAKARHNELANYLPEKHHGIASINSPMQCMMKEICSQCMQVHRDIKTGKLFHIFSCFNQDQNIDEVDWQMLSERLKQNAVQEKQSAALINHCQKQLI